MSLERHLNHKKGKHRVHHIGYLSSHRRTHWLHVLVVALILGLAKGETDSECPTGWFGTDCKYQCHCAEKSQCKSDGECPGGCAVFWFGPKCQYRYAAVRLKGLRKELTVLTDKDSSTCLEDASQGQYVELVYPQRIHWIRFELSSGGAIKNVTLAFWQRSETGDKIEVCNDSDTRLFKGRLYDVFCERPDLVHFIAIFGDVSSTLCSLQVPVGRNVAIKQPASQSSTVKPWLAKNAVDSVIPRWSKDMTEADLKKTCARTSVQEHVKWSVILPREIHLSHITIYGGAKLPAEDCCQSDLEPVTVSARSKKDELVFQIDLNVLNKSLNVNESTLDMERTILPTEMKSGLVQSIVITTANRSLTLCEVQIFEEAVCPRGFYGMNCELACNCIRHHGICHPFTGKCPKGCEVGYRGTTCGTPCAKGRHGFDCKKRCSSNCKTGSHGCRRDGGQCYGGCRNDYAPPFCLFRKCRNRGTFGKNCKFLCKCYKGRPCHGVTGKCIHGDDGTRNGNCVSAFFGPDCQQRSITVKTTSDYALMDYDDTTCITSPKKLAFIKFRMTGRILFVRIIAKNIDAVHTWSIIVSGPKGSMPCHEQWKAKVQKNAVDFYCVTTKRMNKLTISGSSLQGLCSTFVGVGREHAFKQPSRMKTTFQSYYATMGNDGIASSSDRQDHRTCPHSERKYGREETWRVTLPKVRNVTRVTVAARYVVQYRARMQYYGVRLINPSKRVVLQHKRRNRESNKLWQVVEEIPYTPEVIKYAELFNEKYSDRYLNFCEFYLYAARDCPPGTYGLICEHTCNCKKDSYCFVETGACSTGCRDGFGGYDCWQTCPPGKYGSGCTKSCSKNCFGGPHECSGIDGTCSHGCDEGYQLPTCDEVCVKGTYGRSCLKACSSGCGGEGSECGAKTGVCEDSRCKPGYLGSRCDEICPPPNFGLDCLQNCSAACASAACHHEDGRCDDCPRGKTGDYCEERCPEHYHGPRCIYNCSTECYLAQCEPVLGRCKSCKIGLVGEYCKEDCEPGFYGWGCKDRCSIHCKGGPTTCFATNGSCMHGCENDMPPPRCKEPGSLLGAMGTSLSVLLLLILLGLATFFALSERTPGPKNRGGEGASRTGSEGVPASHHTTKSGVSKERSTALSLSKERSTKTSSKSNRQEQSKSKELTSGTNSSSQGGRPTSSGM